MSPFRVVRIGRSSTLAILNHLSSESSRVGGSFSSSSSQMSPPSRVFTSTLPNSGSSWLSESLE